MSDEYLRLHVIVSGIVQGVGFRFFVFNHGRQMQLSGWVRNKINGTVEILTEGHRHELEKFLDLINQGPSHAQVEKTDVSWLVAQSDLPPFTVRMDG
jgi:acylphosphatase